MSNPNPGPTPRAPSQPDHCPGPPAPPRPEPGRPGAGAPPPTPPAGVGTDPDRLPPGEAEHGLPRVGQPHARRLARAPDPPRPPLTAAQRLLILDAWRRSGLPARDFAPLVGVSRHTLYAWKKKFDAQGPTGSRLPTPKRARPRASYVGAVRTGTRRPGCHAIEWMNESHPYHLFLL